MEKVICLCMEGSVCESGRETRKHFQCYHLWPSLELSVLEKKKDYVRASELCVYECKCMKGCGGSTALRSKWSGRPHHTEFYYHLLIHMLISLAMTCMSPAKKEHKRTTPTRACLLPQQTENLYKLIMQVQLQWLISGIKAYDAGILNSVKKKINK